MEGRLTICQHVDRGRRARGHDRAGRRRRSPTSRAGRAPPGRLRRRPSSAGGRYATDAGATLRPRGRRRRRRRSRRRSRGARTRARSRRSRAACPSRRRRARTSARSRYMGLRPGTPIARDRHRPRLHRLVHERAHRGPARRGGRRATAAGRRRRAGDGRARVAARLRLQAEAEGLDPVFRDAGFEWRDAGCSMCLGMNPDILAPGERCASTSNRNFEGRQGRGGRTHLVSPAMAAAAAVTGRLSTCGSSEVDEGRSRRVTGHRRAARPRRRRHRPDHPQAVPEADRAHRLRRVPLLRLAHRTRTSR